MSDKQKLQSDLVEQKLADLNETMQREKVELTPEIERYIEENVQKIQEKLRKKDPIYPSDMEFVHNVIDWISLQEYFRKQFSTMKEFLRSEEVKDAKKEAGKNHLSLGQQMAFNRFFAAVTHNTRHIGRTKIDIGSNFEFPGNGRIIIKDRLSWMIEGNEFVDILPEGLEGRSLVISGCENLKELPSNINIRTLGLQNCTAIKKLPEGLKLDQLNIVGCTGLEHMPKDVEVENIFISKDLKPQVIEDVYRLKKEGKIPGWIKEEN